MAENFTKVFHSITKSTVWQRPDPIRIVWITLLVEADADGEIYGSIPGLAHIARVSLADCETALNEFMQPDHYSRDPSNDGRRIEEIEGGWRIINYQKWRAKAGQQERLAKQRERQKRYRERLQGTDSNGEFAGVTESDACDAKQKQKQKQKNEDNPKKDYSSSGTPADCPHQAIIDLYHQTLPMLPRVREWTPARAQQLRTRWREDPERQTLDYWQRFFEYVKTSDFLCGRVTPAKGKKPFLADLEWLTKSANFTKVREGKYDNG